MTRPRILTFHAPLIHGWSAVRADLYPESPILLVTLRHVDEKQATIRLDRAKRWAIDALPAELASVHQEVSEQLADLVRGFA